MSEANERLEKLHQLTSADGSQSSLLSSSIKRQTSGSSLLRYASPVTIATAPIVSTSPPPLETQHSVAPMGSPVRMLSASTSAQPPLAQTARMQMAVGSRVSSDGGSSLRGVVRNNSGPSTVPVRNTSGPSTMPVPTTTRPVRESGGGAATTGRAVYGSNSVQVPSSVRSLAPAATTGRTSPAASGASSAGVRSVAAPSTASFARPLPTARANHLATFGSRSGAGRAGAP